MRTLVGGSVAALVVWVGGAAGLVAQMDMAMAHAAAIPVRPLAIPETRLGSGTAWQPDATPMHDAHMRFGAWMVTLHGRGFLQYDSQSGPRGAHQVGFTNWAMAMAMRTLGGGALVLRGMLSAEPWTIGARGYPLLLQSGESYGGAPLHDRQHPHDLFMELAALYERPIARNLALSLYLAPVGEPAVGPVAFPHRASAAGDPIAPLAHHWQDGTHVTFGVLTAGLFTRVVKLEASWFNGREPDENRTDFDYRGRRLDSYGARLSVNPTPRWSVSAWYAYLKSPEELHPDEALHRLGAAALTTQAVGPAGTWSAALIYGANAPVGTGRLASSVVLESSLDLAGVNTVFGRAEYVEKSTADLAVTTAAPPTQYSIGALALGYVRTIGRVAGLRAGLGLRGSMNFVPQDLAAVYGGRTPPGIALYVALGPAGTHDAGMMMDRMSSGGTESAKPHLAGDPSTRRGAPY
ncbi:MAG TPA: hypothetical protein VH116_13160 [Gemmatimonadales bacterium]|nr:hypothetical protein [Gemmatimonadales bacterium]